MLTTYILLRVSNSHIYMHTYIQTHIYTINTFTHTHTCMHTRSYTRAPAYVHTMSVTHRTRSYKVYTWKQICLY